MEIMLDGVGKVTCTPDEFVQVMKSGALANYKTAQTESQHSGAIRLDSAEIGPEAAVVEVTAPIVNNSIQISRQEFFKEISQPMAKIALALLRSEGRIAQRELTAATNVSGAAMRRSNGALNKRIRLSSRNQIPSFFSVEEPNRSNGLTDRVFTVAPTVLQFIRDNQADFSRYAAE
jgi:hypothetical protein